MTSFNLGIFGFKIERPPPITLRKGESVIVSSWSWRKFGWKTKQIRLDKNNNVIVTEL